MTQEWRLFNQVFRGGGGFSLLPPTQTVCDVSQWPTPLFPPLCWPYNWKYLVSCVDRLTPKHPSPRPLPHVTCYAERWMKGTVNRSRWEDSTGTRRARLFFGFWSWLLPPLFPFLSHSLSILCVVLYSITVQYREPCWTKAICKLETKKGKCAHSSTITKAL